MMCVHGRINQCLNDARTKWVKLFSLHLPINIGEVEGKGMDNLLSSYLFFLAKFHSLKLER